MCIYEPNQTTDYAVSLGLIRVNRQATTTLVW